ncbi:hypothetical protein [Spirosoma validum]|uniref:Uncharacterized protein n=1 Tax=Spirosoma validum TaxID=2771355 RepID=A0A927B5P1_9BACT|nr:hypothetical protein [Spirosoma validum]MBD2755702.1 hypothetical protein [Spirosoma validum]
MKTLLALLFLSGCAYAQSPAQLIRRDSIPEVFPPDHMPNSRPNNSFYRYHSDPKNVMRATLDNMPIKVPDTSVTYIMEQKYLRHRQPAEPPTQFLKPMPRIVPKRFR